MNQATIYAIALVAAFIFYVTVKGELGQYLAVVGLGTGEAAAAGGGTTSPSATGPTNFPLGQVAAGAQQASAAAQSFQNLGAAGTQISQELSGAFNISGFGALSGDFGGGGDA